MAKQTDFQTRFAALPIIGILRGIGEEAPARLLPLYRDAGLTTLEVTMNTAGAAAMIERAVCDFGHQLNIGAGTVRKRDELDAALGAGAQFIVTPILATEVVQVCVAAGIPVFPGAYTPTEVYTAWTLGATAVKIFPATTGGLAHIKALRAPLEMVPLLPTGGVNAANLADYFEAGVYGVGMGSELFPARALAEGDWEGLRVRFGQVVAAYRAWNFQHR